MITIAQHVHTARILNHGMVRALQTVAQCHAKNYKHITRGFVEKAQKYRVARDRAMAAARKLKAQS